MSNLNDTNFNNEVDNYIRRIFGTEPLEDGEAVIHDDFDSMQRGSNLVFNVDKAIEGLTSIMVDPFMGIGDCRPHAYSKALLFLVYKTENLIELRKAAHYALINEQHNEYETISQKINDFIESKMYVSHQNIFRSNDNSKIEPHTPNIFQSKNHISPADCFHHRRYDLQFNPDHPGIPLQEYLDSQKITTTIHHLTTLESDESAFLKPARYGGQTIDQNIEYSGFAVFRGLPVILDGKNFVDKGITRPKSVRLLRQEFLTADYLASP